MARSHTILCACLFVAFAARASADTTPVGPFGRLVAATPRPAEGPLAFRLIAFQEAERAGLPFDLVDAVMKIESDYQSARIGDVGEIGLMQVRPGTAAMLGFRGTPQELADPAVNIHYGTTYLGQAWHLTKGEVCRTLMKYRAGHGEEAMSALSVSYCARAKAHLVAVGSPLAASITPADLVAAVGEPASPIVGRARMGKGFWAAFQARIKRINARIETKWRGAAAHSPGVLTARTNPR